MHAHVRSKLEAKGATSPDFSRLITSLMDSLFAAHTYDSKVSLFAHCVGSNIEHH